MRKTRYFLAASLVVSAMPSANAHELWIRLKPEADPALVRLYFGDTPAPGEAERVAEIARTQVWADGKPLEVTRLQDGLQVRLPDRRPAILSAFADRGVVDYMGDSFVIYLAAYAQTRSLDLSEAMKLGLGDDQLRLILVSRGEQRPVVRATWRGKPAADVPVEIFNDPSGKPTEVRTDSQGEIACPDTKAGPVSLLTVFMEKTPGKRDGRDYSHTRYKATLTFGAEAGCESSVMSPEECLTRVREVHGAAGPWAVAGYRMGVRGLAELGLPRHSFDLLVIHRCPAEVQYSCIADGLQAATGASPGKMNLKVEETTARELKTVVEDRRTGRCLTFTLRPALTESIRGLPSDRIESEGRRVSGLPDDEIFTVIESRAAAK